MMLVQTANCFGDRLAGLWRDYSRVALALGLLLILAIGAGAEVARSAPEPATQGIMPPAPPPMLLRRLAPDAALQINGAMPIQAWPNPPALPFVFRGDPATRTQALQCLATAVYYEAGNQGGEGERAVAQVVLNRVRHPAFPASVCGVVYEGSTRAGGSQFTFTTDGSLSRRPDAAGWNRAYGIAEAALTGDVYAPVGWATHYHANYVLPYWASTLAKSTVVGAHIFYRWSGSWGRPAAFVQGYAGHEPNALALRNAALAADTAAKPQVSLSSASDGAAQFPFRLTAGDDEREDVLRTVPGGATGRRQEQGTTPDPSKKLRWTLSSAADLSQ